MIGEHQKPYKCEYCGKRFVRESALEAHKCKQKKRREIARTPEGQLAWLYYSKWMKKQKRAVPNKKGFFNSRYFIAFIEFARFVKKVKLPQVDVFIELMIDKQILPPLWTNTTVYSYYIERLNALIPFEKQIETTINWLYDTADYYDCDVSEIFDYIKPAEVIDGLRTKKLSPWILLNSKKFLNWYKNLVDNDKKIIKILIRPKYWKEIFGKQNQKLKKIKKLVLELEL